MTMEPDSPQLRRPFDIFQRADDAIFTVDWKSDTERGYEIQIQPITKLMFHPTENAFFLGTGMRRPESLEAK